MKWIISVLINDGKVMIFVYKVALYSGIVIVKIQIEEIPRYSNYVLTARSSVIFILFLKLRKAYFKVYI